MTTAKSKQTTKTQSGKKTPITPAQSELLKFLLSKMTLFLLFILILAGIGSYYYLRVWAATP